MVVPNWESVLKHSVNYININFQIMWHTSRQKEEVPGAAAQHLVPGEGRGREESRVGRTGALFANILPFTAL